MPNPVPLVSSESQGIIREYTVPWSQRGNDIERNTRALLSLGLAINFLRFKMNITSSLAVFDFDRTIVNDDSDATIINKLRERQPPPEWEAGNHDWTPFMRDVFCHAHSAGMRRQDILDCIAGMAPVPGMLPLLRTLLLRKWDVVILSDANSVFVTHWLRTHDLLEGVEEVITNRAFWHNERLYIEPYMRQTTCAYCPTNMCKKIALKQFTRTHAYEQVVYIGDGRNDFCPVASLPKEATVYPRKGYPLDELIRMDLASTDPQVCCNVLPWEDGNKILKDLFPRKKSF